MIRRLAPLCLCLLLASSAWAEESAIGSVSPGSGLVQVQEQTRRGRSLSRSAGQFFPGNNTQNPNQELFTELQTPWSAAAPGHPLSSGTRLRTGKKGANISLREGVEIRLDRDSSVELTDKKSLRLISGKVWIKSERPLEVGTERHDVRLNNASEVLLSTGTTESALVVLEGRAEVGSAQVGQGEQVQLGEDDLAVSAATVTVETKPAWVRRSTTPSNLNLADLLPGQDRTRLLETSLQKLEADPTDPQANLELAALYLEEARLEEAAKLLKLAPAGERKTRLTSRLALLEGRYAEVDQSIPSDYVLALYAQGRRDEAKQALQGQAEGEASAATLASLAYLVEYPQGHYREAAELLRRALELEPNNAILHQHLGDVYAALSRNDAALSELKKAYELSQGSADSALRLGTLANKLGNHREAVKYLDQFRKGEVTRASDVHHALALGYGYLQSGNSKAALEQAERALTLTKETEPGLRYLAYDLQGIVLAERGSFAAAAKSYGQALDLRPGDPFLLNDLGLSLRALGDLYQAQAKLREARDLAPESSIVRGNLAFVYFLLNQPQRSLTESSKALLYNPDSASLLYQFGVATQQFGRVGQVSLIRQARLLDPLVNTSSRPRILFVGSTNPNSGPLGTLGVRGRMDNLGYNLTAGAANSLQVGDPVSNTGVASAEIGWRISPADHLALFLDGNRTWARSVGLDSFASLGRTEIGYRRELGPDAALWALVRHENDSNTINGDRRFATIRAAEVERDDTRYELRFDWDVAPNSRLSLGYASANTRSYNDTTTFSRIIQSRDAFSQQLDEFWIQNDWRPVDDLRLVFGGAWRKARYSQDQVTFGFRGQPMPTQGSVSEDVIDPFAALTWNYAPGSEFSLSYVKTSAQDRIGLRSYFEPTALLRPVATSSTSILPSPQRVREGVFANTLAGVADLEDFRVRVGHDFGPHLFASLEYADISAKRPNFLGLTVLTEPAALSLDPVALNLHRTEQHSLNSLRLDLEFWDGGDTAGIFSWNHRDFEFDSGAFSGRPWIGVPKDELDLRVFRRLDSKLGISVRPVYQSEIPLARNGSRVNDDAFRLDASLTWTPVADTTIEVGYQNIFNDRSSPQRPGLFTNLVIQY